MHSQTIDKRYIKLNDLRQLLASKFGNNFKIEVKIAAIYLVGNPLTPPGERQ